MHEFVGINVIEVIYLFWKKSRLMSTSKIGNMERIRRFILSKVESVVILKALYSTVMVLNWLWVIFIGPGFGVMAM
jgi:hypothetical protein